MGIKRREIIKVGTLGSGLMAVSDKSIGHNENGVMWLDVEYGKETTIGKKEIERLSID